MPAPPVLPLPSSLPLLSSRVTLDPSKRQSSNRCVSGTPTPPGAKISKCLVSPAPVAVPLVLVPVSPALAPAPVPVLPVFVLVSTLVPVPVLLAPTPVPVPVPPAHTLVPVPVSVPVFLVPVLVPILVPPAPIPVPVLVPLVPALLCSCPFSLSASQPLLPPGRELGWGGTVVLHCGLGAPWFGGDAPPPKIDVSLVGLVPPNVDVVPPTLGTALRGRSAPSKQA